MHFLLLVKDKDKAASLQQSPVLLSVLIRLGGSSIKKTRRGRCFLPPTTRTKGYFNNLAYMHKNLSWFIFSSLMIFGIIRCSDHTRNKLDSWLGDYSYSEPPVKSLAGYSMVMTWNLSANKIDNKYNAILNVTGQQTDFSFLNNLNGNDTTLFVIYDESLSGISQGFHKGDTLFTLSKLATGLQTKWHGLSPILSEQAQKQCNCFVFTSTNENNNTLRVSQ